MRHLFLRRVLPLSAAVLACCCLTADAFAQAAPAPVEPAPGQPIVTQQSPAPDATATVLPAPQAPAPQLGATPESNPALPPPAVEPPAPQPPPPPAAKPDDNKSWLPVFYGFVEGDLIWDSTQSFNDLASNALIARKGTYGGDRSRFTEDIRNSRIGMKLSAPEFSGVKTSAQFEMDFFGTYASGTAESAIFTNSLFRVRHALLKAETPVVDVWVGQTWQLFGWQSYFHPNTVQIQGLPGEIFGRTPQLRLAKVIKTDPVNVEIAVAAARPFARDTGTPDGQAGLRLMVNQWKGLRTVGSTGTTIDAAAIGVSGLARGIRLPEVAMAPKTSKTKMSSGISVDVLIPVVPATPENRNNALTLTGSFVTGKGISDQYTGLTGGLGYPAPANPMMTMPAPTYTPNVDPGVISYDASGAAKLVNWQSFIVGLQYYLPIDNGHVWIAGTYSNLKSSNMSDFKTMANVSKMFDHSQFVNGSLFWDATSNVRFGLDYSWFEQKYLDGVKAHNSRVQFSGFYIF